MQTALEIQPDPNPPAMALPMPPGGSLNAAMLGVYTADMRRFARRRIRDAELAEDAVQDALLAALNALDGFKGNSSPRTWLFGILVHKIQDTFRREGRYVREPSQSASDEWAGDPMPAEAWSRLATADSEDPFAKLASRRLIERIADEVDDMPESLRQVFLRQAIEDESTEDVCRTLGITEANCWVRLHRARKRLSDRLAAYR